MQTIKSEGTANAQEKHRILSHVLADMHLAQGTDIPD
jgi:hypothetical protein